MQAIGCDLEQARRIARRDGPLGDQTVGQVEVEEVDAHRLYAVPVSIMSVSESSLGD
jgi:hypothetical protein